MNRIVAYLLWPVIAIAGAFSFAALALGRGESVNAVWLVTAAVTVYLIAYRFYSKYIAERVLQLDDDRITPAVRHNDGMDYVPTNKWVLYGHHFAAIAGAGPLVGPVLAAQMGFLPGTLWILVGVVIAGAVQDFIVLFVSVRRDGKSLGEMIKMELGPVAGSLALVGVLVIMQWKFAKMAMEVDAARLLVYRAVSNGAQGLPSMLEASMAKAYANEMAIRVTNDALQVFGGLGYLRECPLERMSRIQQILDKAERDGAVHRLHHAACAST